LAGLLSIAGLTRLEWDHVPELLDLLFGEVTIGKSTRADLATIGTATTVFAGPAFSFDALKRLLLEQHVSLLALTATHELLLQVAGFTDPRLSQCRIEACSRLPLLGPQCVVPVLHVGPGQLRPEGTIGVCLPLPGSYGLQAGRRLVTLPLDASQERLVTLSTAGPTGSRSSFKGQ